MNGRLIIFLIIHLLWNINGAIGSSQGADFYFEAPKKIAIDTLSFSFPMYAYLMNTGDSADVFEIVMTRDVPDSTWTTMLSIQGFALPPFVMSAIETLGVGEYDSLIDVTFQSKTLGQPGVEGAGYASLTVTSMRDPSLFKTIDFTFISDGTEILVMDDDGGENYESYYENAIGPSHIQGRWNRFDQTPTQEDLFHFDIIVWETGEERPTLTIEDRQALAGYLDDGGSLFISGQDIGFSLADTLSDEYSQSSLEFYNNYLHAEYINDDAASHYLSGIINDPISDSLDIIIQGGDGANNQTSPSVISPISPAVEIYEYDTATFGALRAYANGHNVVYMAFGFEAINDQAIRFELMQRIIIWLTRSSYAFQKVSKLELDLSLSTYPDARYYTRGDTLGFESVVRNKGDSTLFLQGWTECETPTGFLLSPLFGPIDFSIASNESLSSYLTHRIPNNANLGGPYIYRVFIGFYPDEILAENDFDFFIVPGLK